MTSVDVRGKAETSADPHITSNLPSLISHNALASAVDPNNNSQPNRNSLSRKSKRVRKQTGVSRRSFLQNSLYEQLDHLPPLQYETADNREEALIRKIRQCHQICNFVDPGADAKNKAVKRAALNDIIDFMSCQTDVVTENVYSELTSMIQVNIFRDLSPSHDISPLETLFAEDDDPVEEVSWPHLQLIYDLFLRFLEHPEFDRRIAKRYITKSFVFNLLRLFQSLDNREREMLRTIVHRIYGKMIILRPYVRLEISNIFLTCAFEDGPYYGVSELLEVMSSIISGFAVPVKDEHLQFLFKVLIPLHKPSCLPLYHENLTLCILQYIERDPTLAPKILEKIMRLWPRTNSMKTVHMVNEVEAIVRKIEVDEETKPDWLVPLTRKLADCVRSQNFQVAERALLMWSGDVFLKYFKFHYTALMPIMFLALYQTSRDHWSPIVIALVYQMLKILMEFKPLEFEDLVDKYRGRGDGSDFLRQEKSHEDSSV